MNSDDVEVRKQRTAAAMPADGSGTGGAYRGQREAPSIYGAALPQIALLGAAAAFGAAGLSLALLGVGVPFVMAALIAACCAGLLIYALGRWALARSDLRAKGRAAPPPDDRFRAAADRAAMLRHELRGALQPALTVSDRLLKSDDPAIRRAGEAVVRSVERATELIIRHKQAGPPDDA